LKHIPACINAAHIELLVQDIPVQPPVVISSSSRTMQEKVEAKDLPPLDVEAVIFSQSALILQEHFRDRTVDTISTQLN
jgi:hypothetical protein